MNPWSRAGAAPFVLCACIAACGSSSDAPVTPGVHPNEAGADANENEREAGDDASANDGAANEANAGEAGSEGGADDAGADDAGEAGANEAGANEAGANGADAGGCTVVVEAHLIEGQLHMPVCSPLSYGTNPPSSGNHYPIWAAYRTYQKTFLRGFWVHDLEHGAVVITYNCPNGCSDEVARAQAFIDALPADCGSPARRIVMLPDPELDVRFAASAWGYTLKASCFDAVAFSSFVAAHYGHAPEDICSDGVDPLTSGTGATPLCP